MFMRVRSTLREKTAAGRGVPMGEKAKARRSIRAGRSGRKSLARMQRKTPCEGKNKKPRQRQKPEQTKAKASK